MRFRRLNEVLIERTWPHRQDSQKLVAITKQGSQQLEELFAQERAERERQRREMWGE
jgi:glutathione-regulated potassium-efflux system ancillary protein KefC